MLKKELDPPFPPKSWAGLPRSLTRNRNNEGGRGSKGSAPSGPLEGGGGGGGGGTEDGRGSATKETTANLETTPKKEVEGERTRYSKDFDNIELRYGEQLALGRDSFRGNLQIAT